MTCRYDVLCGICLHSTDPAQEIPSESSIFTAPTRQHELDHTDHTEHTGEEHVYVP